MVKNDSTPFLRVTSQREQLEIADRCLIAKTFFLRAKGLLGRREFSFGEGILLSRCNSIHMWFMFFSIDVIFLRRKEQGFFEVTSRRKDLLPWRFMPVADLRATDVLELPAGAIQRFSIEVGDILCIS